MLASLGERDRRAVRLGLLLLVPAVLYAAAVRPYGRALVDARAELERERDLLSRELQLLRERTDAVAANQASRDLIEHSERLFDGQEPHAVTAALGDYAAERAEAADVLVQEIAAGTPAPQGAVTAVEISIRAQGDLQGVLTLLRDLEDGPKLVRVARLSIERAGDAASGQADTEVLAFGFVLSGYMRSVAASDSSGAERDASIVVASRGPVRVPRQDGQ